MKDITITLPEELAPEISKKIAEQVNNAYFWEAAKAIGVALQKRFETEGFINQVVDGIMAQVLMDKETYVTQIGKRVQEHLLATTEVLAKEVLKKVSEKVTSYGFIKIGDR